jgi:hypothetical protein
MEKLIITAALVGAEVMKEDTPYLPLLQKKLEKLHSRHGKKEHRLLISMYVMKQANLFKAASFIGLQLRRSKSAVTLLCKCPQVGP